jgi:hypothetical protein
MDGIILNDNANENISDDVMDTQGYLIGLRCSPKDFSEHCKEIFQNSAEVARLAEENDKNVQTKIVISVYLDVNEKPYEVTFEDISTKNTGIKNLKSKNILVMYSHRGDKTGFSEYGEGGSEAIKQMCDNILYETITDTQVSEKLSLDINEAINTNKNFIKTSKYSDKGTYKPEEECFTTGTKITLKNLYEPYKSKELGKQCLNGELANKLSQSFIALSLNVTIKLKIYKNNVIEKEFDIIPTTNIEYNKTKTENEIKLIKHKDTEEIMCVAVIYKNNKPQLITYVDIGKKRNSYQKIVFDSENVAVKNKFKKNSISYDENNYNINNYDIIREGALIHLSTDMSEKPDISKMGFDGWRRVKGNNIVKTNSEPLDLRWSKFKSHRTRHTRFRGAIEYNRDWDTYLSSDKSKTITDDRPFKETILLVIKGITTQYFADMKKKYGYYNTEKKPADDEDDDESIEDEEETKQEPEPEPVNIITVEEEIVEPEPVNVITVEEEIIEPEPINIITVKEEIVEPEQINIITVEEEIVEPEPINIITVEEEIVEPEPINIITVEEEIVEPEPVNVITVEEKIVEHEPINIITVEEEIVEPEPINIITVQEIESEPDDIEPEIVYRNANSAEYVNKEKLLKAIDNALLKKHIHNKFDEALENLYRVHNLFSNSVFECVYSKLTIYQKVEILKIHLNKTINFDTDNVLGGSIFLRNYNIFIKEKE